MIARVRITEAQASALACHSLALDFDPCIDDDERDEAIYRALSDSRRELVFDRRDADRLWRALVDVSNAIDDAMESGASADRRADAGARRSLSILSSAVLRA